MPNNEMDYSLIHRTPDGNGKILVTTPGSPDKGSWETEAELKTYVNQDVVKKTDIYNALDQTNAGKVLDARQGKVLNDAINAISGGIIPKGDILSANLPPASPSNKGWQYYCTDLAKYAVSDGTQWVYFSNTMLTNTMDATDTSHALTNAVVTQCCNEVKGELSQHDARLQNLEQKAGDYSIVQYRGTNAVPTGKAKYGLVKSIVGKTRAWNQLVQNGNFASDDGWVLESGVTASFSGNVATISSTTSSNGIRREIDFINGHKYLVSAEINTESALAVKFGSSSSVGAQVQITTSVFNQFVKYSEIKTASADSYQFYIFVSGTYSNLKVRNVTLYDLTLIFGAGNEPSTVADALAQLPALGQYNAYDAGSLVDTVVSGVKSVGVNIWDEETEGGFFSTTTGEKVANNDVFRTVNKQPCLPNTTYWLKSPCAVTMMWYGIDGTYLGYQGTVNAGATFTTPANCYYLNMGVSKKLYGSQVYNHDIQICLNSYADKTTYHPYKSDTISLSETVTLRSAGSVSDELDVESGVKTRKVGVKTISSSDVATSGSGTTNIEWFKIDKPSDYIGNGNTTSYPITLSNGWSLKVGGSFDDASWVGYYAIGGFEAIWFGFAVGTTLAQAQSALDGVSFTYELATLTNESIDLVPDNTILTEGGGTINTIQDQSPVIDNCLDVGYLTV